jgi:RNA polymerase sigma-70 factor, ECF subfamily
MAQDLHASIREATDAELLARVVTRDGAAMHELHHRYSGRLKRFLTRLTSGSGVLEEVVNDTFMTVWTKAHQFRGEAQVSTWILGIAHRRGLQGVLKESRARQRMREGAEAFVELVDGPDAAQTQDWLSQALAALPVKQRVALELAHLVGLSCDEISVLMQCPVSTVKTRMFYGRRSLQRANDAQAGQTQ